VNHLAATTTEAGAANNRRRDTAQDEPWTSKALVSLRVSAGGNRLAVREKVNKKPYGPWISVFISPEARVTRLGWDPIEALECRKW